MIYEPLILQHGECHVRSAVRVSDAVRGEENVDEVWRVKGQNWNSKILKGIKMIVGV